MHYELGINNKNEIYLSGRVDLTNVKPACIDGEALIDRLPNVKINLADLKEADSSCLAMFVEWIRKCRSQNKDIVLLNMPQSILDLGRVCGLDSILPIEKPLRWQ